MAHFGSPKQPFSSEAQAHLQSLVAGKPGFIIVHCKDQYNRPVASVFVKRNFSFSWLQLLRDLVSGDWRFWKPPWRSTTHVGLAMVQAGLACVYRGQGAQYGGYKRDLERAEMHCKKARKGMWIQGSRYQSPMDFKKQLK
jgi:endonuclease YncB( thermonuclease family)